MLASFISFTLLLCGSPLLSVYWSAGLSVLKVLAFYMRKHWSAGGRWVTVFPVLGVLPLLTNQCNILERIAKSNSSMQLLLSHANFQFLFSGEWLPLQGRLPSKKIFAFLIDWGTRILYNWRIYSLWTWIFIMSILHPRWHNIICIIWTFKLPYNTKISNVNADILDNAFLLIISTKYIQGFQLSLG